MSRKTPLFCIFGIDYPEVSKITVSDLTLQMVDLFWTFREFVNHIKEQCITVMSKDDGSAVFKAYVASIEKSHIDILEIRVNTCRGVSKALYYDLLLLYYDERRIGDHLVNDYALSEHTIVQVFIKVRKETSSASTPIACEHIYQPAAVSGHVRARVKLRLLDAWQAAFTKYQDCRIRHVMQPRGHRDNDFTRIGIVEPFRVDMKHLLSPANARKGDACVIQVLAYDKMTQQSCWFDILIALHSTVKRCKERIVEALRQMDWGEAAVEEIPHLIARRYQENEIEDFLLCDDTMTLSHILPYDSVSTHPRSLLSTVPMLTVTIFVGRHGRQVSDAKGRCVFEEEEGATQLLLAAMSTYLSNFVDRSSKTPLGDVAVVAAVKERDGKPQQNINTRKISGPKQIKTDSKLMARERAMSIRASISRQNRRESKNCGRCVIM